MIVSGRDLWKGVKAAVALTMLSRLILHLARRARRKHLENKTRELLETNPAHGYSVGIIGGGFSAIITARKCRELGIPFHIYEKERDFGGVWLQNDYPGCACDVQIHAYCFSFAIKPKCKPPHTHTHRAC